jgi:SAM-dependent methyltransferase
MDREDEQLLAPMLRADARAALHDAGDRVLSVLSDGADSPGAAGASRFEGVYGPLYDRVIQSDTIRQLAGLAYGDATPVTDLEGFARRAAGATVAAHGTSPPILLDVPCGGGTLLPRLRAEGFTGVVIESDLGAAMLRRAARLRDRLADGATVLLRADAQDLPFEDGVLDGAVSLNGLHCMPDPRAFVRELGRVVRPGGSLHLITLVSGGTRRADLAIRAGQLSGVVPTAPPARATLLRWLRDAGWQHLSSLGGKGLVGYAATRKG